ncbi:MAG: hypothetical protein WC346_10855 [Methanogenium sp.]|jgi:exonuclease SbcC
MIKSLQIENFQSHTDTEIELSPLVTAIIGLNNHGKSSILRAFQKVVRNIPIGNTFITDGKKQCDITLISDTGKVVRTVKNVAVSDANKYTIDDKDEYVKFDTEIPAEVLPLLETSPLQTFGDIEVDFNFQPQLEDLFLMQGDSLPSKRGKILGSVTGVDIVNRAIQLCASAIKSAKSSINRNEQQVLEVDQKLEKYKDLDTLSSKVSSLLTKKDYYEEFSSNLSAYRDILSTLESFVERATIASKTVDSINKKKLLPRLQNIQDIHQRIQICRSLQSLQLQIDNAEYVKSTAKVSNTKNVGDSIKRGVLLKDLYFLNQQLLQAQNVADIARTVQISVGHAEKIKSIQEKTKQYKVIYDSLDQIKKKDNIASQNVLNANIELEKVEKEKKALEQEIGVCPLCGRAF